MDADLQAYFDSIPQAPLHARVQSKVSDGRVLALVEAFLQQPIFDGLAQWTADDGTPQGAVISPLLANIYLDPLDHLMAAAGFEMVRYADDFVILCRTARRRTGTGAGAALDRRRPDCGCIPRKHISWTCATRRL